MIGTKLNRRKREILTGYMFILPWLIGFLLFMAYPIYYSLYMSFNKVYITASGIKTDFLKWENYKFAFLSDPYFLEELIMFLKSAVLMIPIVIVFSLFVALMINQPIRMKGFFRAIFFLPVVITSGEVVSELFSQGAATIPIIERYGVIDLIEGSLNPSLAMPLVNIIEQLIIVLWYSGVQILIFLAGLQKVNKQTYEAAAIDGASPWEIFWKITLPSIKPFILVNIIYTTVDLSTNTMNEVIVMIKENMFKVETGFGYATSLAWIYFLVIFIILLISIFAFTRKDRYEFKKS
jgi:ABC-type sugar transport system permease subunit